MQKLRLGLLVGLFMVFITISAEEVTLIHVDIATVTSSAELVPVDGIRSSGQPDAAAFELLVEAGYVAVVDMRGQNENRGLDQGALLEQLDLGYITLPLTSPDAINFENAAALEEILAGIDGPVLLHCGSGNRVGALLALMKSKQGASDEDAIAYGRAAGLTGLEPVVRARLAEKD
jgi:uncharacterized protein (TIGR01244 family)